MSNDLDPQVKQAIDDNLPDIWDDIDPEDTPWFSDFNAYWSDLAPSRRRALKEAVYGSVRALALSGVEIAGAAGGRSYESCHFDEYEDGDWARITDTSTSDRFEFQVIRADNLRIEGGAVTVMDRPNLSYERHPKPVVHPDPEIHKIILDHDDNDKLYQAQIHWARYRYLAPGEIAPKIPAQFENWTAVELRAAEEEGTS